MRKFFLFLLIWMLTSSINANPVKYLNSTPESGASISSFDITLNFDISDAVESLGGGDWGIGYTGNTSGKSAFLYEGSAENGTLLATIMTSNFNGKSEGFVAKGTSVKLPIPIGLNPEVGKTYTIVIKNTFCVFEPTKSTLKTTSYLKFETDPLVLTFVGASASSEELLLQNASVSDGSQLKSLQEVRYSFNSDISVCNNAKVLILEDSQPVYESASVSVAENDSKAISVKFDDATLWKGHTYKLSLPSGIVSLSSNSAIVNKEFSVNVSGESYKYFSASSVTPKEGDKGLFESGSIIYDIPAESSLVLSGVFNDHTIKLYKESIAPENLIKTLDGTPIVSNTGFKWDLDAISFDPSTAYILYKEGGKCKLFINNREAPEWTNEETKIRFSTPSVEEANLPQIEFGTPVIGTHNKGSQFQDGMKLSSLNYLDIDSKGEYKSFVVNPKAVEENRNHGYLYEITSNGDVLVKELTVGIVSIDDTYDFYTVSRLTVDATFYEGKKYRIVIPSGVFTAGSMLSYNYITNPELSYTVEGSTPTEITEKDCSIAEGSTVSRLYNVTWTFNGNIDIKENGVARLKIAYPNGSYLDTGLPLFRTSFSDTQTRIQAICTLMSTSDGNPIEFKDGWTGTITLPEGVLYAAADESIINKNIVINFLGATPAPEVVEPEYVTLDVSYLDADKSVANTTSTEIVKGKNVNIQVPSDLWTIASLMRYNGDSTDGTELKDFAEGGKYTSSAIKDNTRFEVALEYAAPLIFCDTSTGIAELPDSDIQVFSDGENIVVKGLVGDEFITVFTMTGLTVGSHEAAPGKDTVNIMASKGQTYIVRIQKADGYDFAAKIMH